MNEDKIEISIQLNDVGDAEIHINDIPVMSIGVKGIYRYLLSGLNVSTLRSLNIPLSIQGTDCFEAWKQVWRVFEPINPTTEDEDI